MKRAIYFSFTDFNDHIDLSALDSDKISIKPFIKGQLRSNGKTVQPFNSINIYLNDKELPDEYDARIETLIAAIGGEKAVKDLVSKYQARINAVVLGIPSKTGDALDGYISCETMKKLCDLKLNLDFYYT